VTEAADQAHAVKLAGLFLEAKRISSIVASISAQHGCAGIGRFHAEFLLDADQLVVLGEPVGTRQRAGLDLSAIGGDGQIGDGRNPRSRRSGGS
jgi:hypothetical protein